MALIGGLRLIADLTFLGVIIALCTWLLSKLFPATSNPPDNTTQSASQSQQTYDHLKNKKNEPAGVVRHRDSRNKK